MAPVARCWGLVVQRPLSERAVGATRSSTAVRGAGTRAGSSASTMQRRVAGLAPGLRPEEPPQHGHAGPAALRRHPGEEPQRLGLTRRGDHGLDALDAQGPDQLVLEVGRARVEAQSAWPVGILGDGQARRREASAQDGLLPDVVEPCERHVEPGRTVPGGEGPGVGDAAHGDDLDPSGLEVTPLPLGQRAQGHPVAVPLDQHDGTQRAHPTIGRVGVAAGQPRFAEPAVSPWSSGRCRGTSRRSCPRPTRRSGPAFP